MTRNTVVRSCARFAWRFATGAHMDGRVRRNNRTGRVLPRYTDWYWNRWSRLKRAVVRHAVMLSCGLLAYGLATIELVTIVLLLSMVPFAAWRSIKAIQSVRNPVREIRPSIDMQPAIDATSVELDNAFDAAMEDVADENIVDALPQLQLTQGRRRKRKES